MDYSYPNSLKKLRACINCHLIKTESQFLKEGCDNCTSINLNEISNYITSNFKGMIAITYPQGSWCAKWLNKNDLIPGFYCLDMVTFNENDDNGDNYENDNEEEEEYYDNKIIDDN